MTVSSTNRKAGPFAGNGVTAAFPFAFRMLDADDLLAVTLVTATGVETELQQDADYTAVLNADQDGDPGGTLTMTDPLAVGVQLVITSDVEPTQDTVLTNQGGFYPAVLNDVHDKLTILIQQATEAIDRSLRLSITSDADPTITPLADGLLRWNDDATAIDTVPLNEALGALFYATSYADVFTGDGVQTAFALTADPQVLSNMDVAVAGVTKYPTSDYTLAGGVVTFAVAPANAAKILVRYQQTAVLTAGVLSVAGLMGTVTDVALKAALALNLVENKSSADIRGELTSANVIDGLGSAPMTYDREKVATPAIAAGVLTLDLATATQFVVPWTENITSVVLSNVPAGTDATSWTLILVANGTAYTWSPGAAFNPAGDEAPDWSTTNGDRNYVAMTTRDAGANVDYFPSRFCRG